MDRSQRSLNQLLKDKELRVRVKEPSKSIYDFKGTIEYSFKGKQDGVPDEIDELSETQFVPKGSTLKLSDQVHCMVVYTGKETKLVQNLGQYRFKRSLVQKRFERVIAFNLVIFILCVLLCTIYCSVMTEQMYETHWYIYDNAEDSPSRITTIASMNFFVLYNYLVPLDLPFVY